MLAWRISEGKRINGLSGPWPMLLYTWLIAHADNVGRFHGEPEQVKALVMPRQDAVTADHIKAWLSELAGAGLIVWYASGGMRYLQFPQQDWSKHQRLDRMSRSDLPSPPVTTGNHLATADNHWLPEVEGEVEVEVEAEGEKEVEGEGESREEGASPSQPRSQANLNPNGKPAAFWNSKPVRDRIEQAIAAGFTDEQARSIVLREEMAT